MKINIVLFLLVALLFAFASSQAANAGVVGRGQAPQPPVPLVVPGVSIPQNPFAKLKSIINNMPKQINKLPPPQNVTFTFGNFVVTVPKNGRVPKYTLHEKNSNNTYVFSFSNIVEMVNLKVGKINTWIPIPQSFIILKNLQWSFTNTTNSFTLRGFCPFKRFTAVSLVNKFLSGTGPNGQCAPTVPIECSKECIAGCANKTDCIQGCEFGTFNNVDSCYAFCNGAQPECLVNCLKTLDCIKRDCSNKLKIDLVLEGYKWITPKIVQTSRLDFNYKISGKDSLQPTRIGETLNFGNFFLQFNSSSFALPPPCKACSTSGNCVCTPNRAVPSSIRTVPVAGPNKKTTIQISFNRFQSGLTLYNDPAIGLAGHWSQSDIRALAPMNRSSSSFLYVSFVLLAILLAFSTYF